VHGPTLSELERKHRRDLLALRDELRLGDKAELAAAVDRSQVPALLAANDLLVNNMRAGAPDKVVYEAAASCVPVLASNPVFDTLLPDELRFPRDDPAELAARVADFAEHTPEDRAALGRALRETVAREHSVESWAKGILQLTR
jgi:glycosyltransferase involved in cell wall biosynthesis